MLCPVRICKHEGEQKYLYKMRRRAGSAPAPSPLLRCRSRGGEGTEADSARPCILSRYFCFPSCLHILTGHNIYAFHIERMI